MDPSSTLSLRARKKAQTRSTIQQEALRLFLSQGYDATTIEEIANSANVSPMTFYRYFPTKEDVILADDYDPLIAELIATRPGDEPAIDAIQHTLIEGLTAIEATDRDALLVRTRLILRTPALRARLWEQQEATAVLIANALASRPGQGDAVLEMRVIAATILAAATTAISVWTETDGAQELPHLLVWAFATLRRDMAAGRE